MTNTPLEKKPTETISFRCPKCNNLCGFEKRFAGRTARCVRCQVRFTIPAESDQYAFEKKPETAEPEAGFYRNIFVNNFKAFTDLNSLEGLIFVFAAVCFEFFMGHIDYSFTMPGFRLQLPVGLITMFITRGCLFWYYAETISWTAMETRCFPDICIGTGFEFIGNIIKSTYFFIVAVALSLIPPAIIASIAGQIPTIVKLVLFSMGLFLLPSILISMFVGRQMWHVFRVDYIIRPIIRAFVPYATVACLLILAGFLQGFIISKSIGGYGVLQKQGALTVSLFLFANLAVTAMTIFTMRTIGLFCRHYGNYMPHTWAENDYVSKVS